MSIQAYLEAEPLAELVHYRPVKPGDAVAFVGTLRKHPYDAEKCLLIADPAGQDPAIFEFRLVDVVSLEELPSLVDEAGHSRNIVRIWLRRGSLGVRYEPFEVDEPLRKLGESSHLRESIMRSVRSWS